MLHVLHINFVMIAKKIVDLHLYKKVDVLGTLN